MKKGMQPRKGDFDGNNNSHSIIPPSVVCRLVLLGPEVLTSRADKLLATSVSVSSAHQVTNPPFERPARASPKVPSNGCAGSGAIISK